MQESQQASNSDSKYKRPESVLVLVYSIANSVLLLKRTRPDNYWQSVTGSLNWQESPRDAAERELFEETGIAISGDTKLVDLQEINCFPILPAWRSRYDPAVEHNVEHVFSICLTAEQPVTLNPQEHSEAIWLDKREAMRSVNSYTNKKAIFDHVPPKKDME